MDCDRCCDFVLRVPRCRSMTRNDSSDGSDTDTSLHDVSGEESSSDGSYTDDSDLDDSREVCTLREDVLELLPGAEKQLLNLSRRYPNIEQSKLDHLWDLVKIIQNEKDCHWKFHEQDLEVEVYDAAHRGLQENMNAVKDDVYQEKSYQTELYYMLCQAQKQNRQLRQDLISIHDRCRKKMRNLEYEHQDIEYETSTKINIARKQLQTETTELRSELEELQRDLWKEKENGKKNRSQNKKLQIEIDRQRHDNEQFRAELNRTQSILHKKEKQMSRLNRMLKRTTDENARLKDTALEKEQQLSNERSELEKKVQLLIKEKEGLAKSLKHTRNLGRKQVPNDNTMLQRTNAEMKREIEKLRLEMKNQSEDILKSKEMEKEYMNTLNLLKEDKTADITAKEIQELNKENSELKIKVQQLVEEKTKLTEDLKHEKDARKKNDSNKKSTLREKNEEFDKLHLNIKKLKNDILQEKTNAEEVKKENKNMQEILKQTRKEKESLTKSSKETQRQLRKNISELEKNIEELHKNKKNMKEDFIQDSRSNRSEKDFRENLNLLQQNYKFQKEMEKMLQENQLLQEKINRERDIFKTKEYELQNEFRQLLKEKESFTEDLKNAKEMVMKDDACKNQNFQEIFKTFQKDVDELQLQNRRLNDALKQEKENVRKIEKGHSKEKSELLKSVERQQKDIINLKAKIVENEARTSKVNVKENTKLDSEQDLQERLTDTLDRLKHMQKELDDTKSRLSRAMGDKLTDNNPNIADLSDKNRPTKISERYQELYDNQWTDAFEIVNGACRNEEKTINILRIILKDTLEFCQAQAVNQMIQIKASFLKGEELPANMVKQLKDCRKAMAEQYGKQLYKQYWAHLGASKSEKTSHAMTTPNYVKECFEICWLMTVQDPPVVFGPDIHRNDAFNKEHYKAYTRSGDRVEYVVWPVLLLHQNGPVLCKGVAQGK